MMMCPKQIDEIDSRSFRGEDRITDYLRAESFLARRASSSDHLSVHPFHSMLEYVVLRGGKPPRIQEAFTARP